MMHTYGNTYLEAGTKYKCITRVKMVTILMYCELELEGNTQMGHSRYPQSREVVYVCRTTKTYRKWLSISLEQVVQYLVS
jgi:hypothetical protein